MTAGSVSSSATALILRRLAGRDRAPQLDVVREPDRQAVRGERCRRRHQAAPDRLAALAVEDLAGGEIALGGRHDVGRAAPAGSRSARRAAPPRRC